MDVGGRATLDANAEASIRAGQGKQFAAQAMVEF